ncbi:MAG: hypothetical protein ACUVUC_00215 [Thermoguttaceae bacterium]
MKRQAQAAILAEWDRRRNEFSSFGQFVEAAIKESEWARRVWATTVQDKGST